MRESLQSRVRTFRLPISRETRQRLHVAWERLPQHLRTSQQFLGRQYAGCGATIGAMPRCDFACRGCYLGAEATHIPAQSIAAIQEQLRQICTWLGEGGNVQLTDGEVMLRPEGDLVELIHYARAIGLVPMLMTHGDSLRRKPGPLQRLMRDGGLTELSIHIDTTQRGRRGSAYKDATREAELLPLRHEFAAMIRAARQETGLTLDVATTFTVTRENLDDIPLVIRWLCGNADVFKMISFQPIAQVGRTEDGLGGSVTVSKVWERVAEGLYGNPTAVTQLVQQQGWLGHPECSRFLQGLVVCQPDVRPEFRPLFHHNDSKDHAIVSGLMSHLGGLTFRLDNKWRAAARLAGVVTAHPRFLFGQIIPFLLRWPGRFDPIHPFRLTWRWLRGAATVRYLNIVSHHFMSPAELNTEQGQERLAVCAILVPVNGRLVSMCEVNAGGVRERYYAALRAERDAAANQS
jgi:hypothetical protein